MFRRREQGQAVNAAILATPVSDGHMIRVGVLGKARRLGLFRRKETLLSFGYFVEVAERVFVRFSASQPGERSRAPFRRAQAGPWRGTPFRRRGRPEGGREPNFRAVAATAMLSVGGAAGSAGSATSMRGSGSGGASGAGSTLLCSVWICRQTSEADSPMPPSVTSSRAMAVSISSPSPSA